MAGREERLDKKEARIRARRSKHVRGKSGEGVFDKKDGGFKEGKFKRFAKKYGRLSDKLKKVSGKSKNTDPYADGMQTKYSGERNESAGIQTGKAAAAILKQRKKENDGEMKWKRKAKKVPKSLKRITPKYDEKYKKLDEY